jgi:hypothetical protein
MCKPKTPKIPPLPPERAAQRAPSRGTVSAEARRQVEATYGSRNAPAMILAGSTNTPALSTGGATRASSSAATSQMTSILGG